MRTNRKSTGEKRLRDTVMVERISDAQLMIHVPLTYRIAEVDRKGGTVTIERQKAITEAKDKEPLQ